MFSVDTTKNITISSDFVTLAIAIVVIFLLYFFSSAIQQLFGRIFSKIGNRLGIIAKDKDYKLQRYIYQHSKSPLSRLYTWLNTQLIALDLKRQGITAIGYLIFWGIIAVIAGLILSIVTNMGILFTPIYVTLCFVFMMLLTRVFVSERIERREADVMNAIDLIIPEAGNGIKNAISTYIDNFAPSIQPEFRAFLTNINELGFSFEDAMIILTDNLGVVFKEFSQKAIYFERVGELEMLEIFTDITETNRLRRQLRDENAAKFTSLKTSFLVSTLMTFGYFIFIVVTDDFSRNFFLLQPAGKFLLVVIIVIVFLVLSYISTIKSKAI